MSTNEELAYKPELTARLLDSDFYHLDPNITQKDNINHQPDLLLHQNDFDKSNLAQNNQVAEPPKMRRLIVGGRVKYLPITTESLKSKVVDKSVTKCYAQKIENETKKKNVSNAKNFTDLRKAKLLQSIHAPANMDTNHSSTKELRQLSINQRKKDLEDQKKKSVFAKRESAVEEILKNDHLSKFAKMVAIKNLSVHHRHSKKMDLNEIK